PARIAEVTLPVELSDVPRLLVADAIDGADEITIRHRMRRLLEPPEILRKSSHSCRRIENDLSAVQTECTRALGEVPVVTDVHADTRECSVETRIPEIAGPEIKLLPESRIHVWNVVLAILAEILSIGVDYRGGVV